MVRNYKKRQEEKIPDALMKEAVRLVLSGSSLRIVAKSCNVPRTTCRRYVNEAKVEGVENVAFNKSTSSRAVFTVEQDMFENYLKIAAKLNHGLTKRMTREFAWEYAKRLELKYPDC